MSHQVLDQNGHGMDAHLDLEPSAVVFHSRGGSRSRGDEKNRAYGPALRLLLDRIAAAKLPIEGAWVDSNKVQGLPIAQRVILNPAELSQGPSEAFRLMSSRMREVGHVGSRAGGNSTKRIRIKLSTTR